MSPQFKNMIIIKYYKTSKIQNYVTQVLFLKTLFEEILQPNGEKNKRVRMRDSKKKNNK